MSGSITDAGSGVNASTATYAVTDEYGSVQPSGHVILGSDGEYSCTIQLQASRNGDDKDGRQYIITASAVGGGATHLLPVTDNSFSSEGKRCKNNARFLDRSPGPVSRASCMSRNSMPKSVSSEATNVRFLDRCPANTTYLSHRLS